MLINFESLWDSVIEHREWNFAHSIHGPDHWKRVERNACILVSQTGSNIRIARLFAIFHDRCRVDDGWDRDLCQRAADYAARLRGTLFELQDREFEQLYEACVWHTDGIHHEDPTIGTCWDADRLDLGRIGISPNAKYMGTAFGAEIAERGTIRPWIHLADPILGQARRHPARKPPTDE